MKINRQDNVKPMSNTFDIQSDNDSYFVSKKPEPQAVALTHETDTSISKDRLHDLEGRFLQKMVAANKTATDAIKLILIIRDERQYLADGYESFDAYMEDRWQHTRQWVEQMEKHLALTRLMQEKLGITPDEAKKRLTVYDATILRPLQNDPDVLVEALKEAEERYKATGKKSPKTLKDVVQKWESFKTLKEKLQLDEAETPPEEMPDPLTPEEFNLLDQLCNFRCSSVAGKTLIDLAKKKSEVETIQLPLALDKVCEEEKSIPSNEQLLHEARGEALKELVAPLILRVKGWTAAEKPQSRGHENGKPKAEKQKADKPKVDKPDEPDEPEEPDESDGDGELDWFQDDLSLELEDDPRKRAERDDGPLDSSDLVAIAADCLADACKRDLDDPAKTSAGARKAKEWAEKLMALCEALEPEPVSAIEQNA